MAKNYTFAEAVRIINAGADMESITDIGRRYPVLLHKVTKVTAKAGDEFVDLMNFMPDHLTANKVNAALKNAIGDMPVAEDADEELGESEETVVKPAKATKAVKKEEASESTELDYESMSGKELWELLGKYGKRKDCKDKMGGAKKDDMIAYINKYGLESEDVEEEAETEKAETEEATETSDNPYEGKSAMELFKECKKRGIKAAPKKPAKYYAELLAKADEEVVEEETESESDDWDEETEAAEEPKKPAKKAEKEEKKPAKKTAKTEEATDDDDDWDI